MNENVLKELRFLKKQKQSSQDYITILYVQCAVIRSILCHCSLSAFLRKKIGKPKEEIGNLNGFEYM
jgi:hypothetical protein